MWFTKDPKNVQILDLDKFVEEVMAYKNKSSEKLDSNSRDPI